MSEDRLEGPLFCLDVKICSIFVREAFDRLINMVSDPTFDGVVDNFIQDQQVCV